MTRSDIQSRIKFLKEELENRHKYGTIKIANSDGTPVSVENLQTEMYSLIFKLSRMD